MEENSLPLVCLHIMTFPSHIVNLYRYKKRGLKSPLKNRIRQRPIFPGRYQPSIVGAWELNFCVRNGNRCGLPAISTGNLKLC